MSKVDCKDCQFYHNGRCEELGEYRTPGECECSWFATKAIKKTCVAEIAKNAKQTVFDRITQSPEVLAPQFVYKKGQKMIRESKDYDGWNVHKISTQDIWKSTILPDAVFGSKAEAISATVARLKEKTQ